MTTKAQNNWAQYLEGATQKEIRQMAEYAVDHLDSEQDLIALRDYLAGYMWDLRGGDQ